MNHVTTKDTDALHLNLDGFEGPLDLLLALAQRQKVDLTKISVVMLVEQYLLAMTGAERADLIQRADWLVMAAWLTWLKSRLLLPTDPNEAREAEEAQEVLTGRLVELEEVRRVADWLDGRPQLGWDMFERGNFGMTKVIMPGADYVMLLETCLSLLRAAACRPVEVYQTHRVPGWTLHQAMDRIQALLHARPQGGDLLGFLPGLPEGLADRLARVRDAIASTFVASLELAREAYVTLEQDSDFEPITVVAARTRTSEPADPGMPNERVS